MNDSLIKYRRRMGQVKDFKSLFIGDYTPSDIDVCYQLNSHGLIILGELKVSGVEVPTGQMIMLRDIVNTYLLAGKRALLFIGEHVTHPSQPIDVGQCNVIEIEYVDPHDYTFKKAKDINQPVIDVMHRYLRACGVDVENNT